MFYDFFGCRVSSVVGAVGTTVGMVLLWASTLSMSTNWLFYISLVVINLASLLNGISLFGFIWWYPAFPSIIIALGNSTVQIDSILGYLVTWMMSALNASIGTCFLILAIFPILASWPLWFLTPSPEAFRMHSEALARYKPIEYPRTLWRIFTDSIEVLFQKPGENFFMFFASFWSFIYVSRFSDMFRSMVQLMVHPADVHNIGLVFYVSYAGVGVLITPVLGAIMDKLQQPVRFFIFMTVVLAVSLALFSIEMDVTQILSAVSVVLYQSCWWTFIPKWFVRYAPPNLLGTTTGLYISFAGGGSWLVSTILPHIIKLDSLDHYFWSLLTLGSLGIFFSVAFIIYILGCKKKVPAVPPLPQGYRWQTDINGSDEGGGGRSTEYNTFHAHTIFPAKWVAGKKKRGGHARSNKVEPRAAEKKLRFTRAVGMAPEESG